MKVSWQERNTYGSFMTLVSVLIPTFNQAKYIGQAVESALKQDWPELEVVVSDDASSDETQHVLEKFRDNERVRISRNTENLGRVGNYRKCLYELAHGAWALILDGDDYLIDSSYISRAMTLAQADSSIDLLFANAYRRRDDIDGSLHKPHENRHMPDLLEGKDLFLRLATEKVSLFHLTCLYKVQKARALDTYRADIISSDWESLFRYILTGRVAFFSDCVAAWRIHGQNATRTLSVEDRVQNMLRITGPYREAKAQGVFPSRVIETWFDSMLFRNADVNVRDLIRSGDGEGRRRYLRELKKINPKVYARIRRRPKIIWKRLIRRPKIIWYRLKSFMANRRSQNGVGSGAK
jgi:glycosyltransferase involved in cell wall biosynthesis